MLAFHTPIRPRLSTEFHGRGGCSTLLPPGIGARMWPRPSGEAWTVTRDEAGIAALVAWLQALQPMLVVDEFIRRVLQPVWPPGFHKVRYDGLWSPVHRPLLHHLQRCLARHAAAPPPTAPEPAPQATDAWCLPFRAGPPCPACGQGLLVVLRAMPRLQRRPP